MDSVGEIALNIDDVLRKLFPLTEDEKRMTLLNQHNGHFYKYMINICEDDSLLV